MIFYKKISDTPGSRLLSGNAMKAGVGRDPDRLIRPSASRSARSGSYQTLVPAVEGEWGFARVTLPVCTLIFSKRCKSNPGCLVEIAVAPPRLIVFCKE